MSFLTAKRTSRAICKCFKKRCALWYTTLVWFNSTTKLRSSKWCTTPRWGCSWPRYWARYQRQSELKTLIVWGWLLIYFVSCLLSLSTKKAVTLDFCRSFWTFRNSYILLATAGNNIYRTTLLTMEYGVTAVLGENALKCTWNSKCMKACWGWKDEQAELQVKLLPRQRRPRKRRNNKAKLSLITEASKQRQPWRLVAVR